MLRRCFTRKYSLKIFSLKQVVLHYFIPRRAPRSLLISTNRKMTLYGPLTFHYLFRGRARHSGLDTRIRYAAIDSERATCAHIYGVSHAAQFSII